MANTKLTTESFIERAKEKHGNYYNYNKLVYNGYNTKVCITCPKHGDFEQIPFKHMNGSKCPKCEKTGKLTTESFIKRAKEKHKSYYSYENVKYTNAKTKIHITCPEHGDFEQQPRKHLEGNGCTKCANKSISAFRSITKDQWLTKVVEIHKGKYNYDKSIYIDIHTKVCIICPKHGVFYQTPNNHRLGHGCTKCSKSVSKKETEVLNFIKSVYFGEILANTKSVINPFEVDIFIPEFKLAIEFNGLYWHSELHLENNYHIIKTKLCKEKDIRLIHIFEDEWDYKKDIVKSRIQHALNINTTKVFARKCEVFEIDKFDSQPFLIENHIQGTAPSSLKLGLYHDELLVAVMTFIKSRFSKIHQWELLRYCPLSGYNIVGGASKLLKAFERWQEPENIISYCDKRWGTGVLYDKLGFRHTHDSDPTYWYFVNTHKTIRETRVKYQKHKLENILQEFDKNISEHKNMLNHNFLRIYDCGNMTFVKKY